MSRLELIKLIRSLRARNGLPQSLEIAERELNALIMEGVVRARADGHGYEVPILSTTPTGRPS